MKKAGIKVGMPGADGCGFGASTELRVPSAVAD